MKELKLKILNSDLTVYIVLWLFFVGLFYGLRLIDYILFYGFNI